MTYHNWFALPERPVSDARVAFVLPEYLKIFLSKSLMRNVAWFRIRIPSSEYTILSVGSMPS